ncbi:MAG: N-acetylglucosamine-6-phosphate deacetylase [Clostridia bacterium]|nr:N-acetylglucosamine-6-phosphate deacetylase [Clostridia bacterium]
MIIKGGTVITPFEKKRDTNVICDGDRITSVGGNSSDKDVFDATGLYVLPGLVDIHTHGGFGGDYMDATEESFDKALSFQSQNGITSVLATSMTAPVEEIELMLEMTRKYMKRTDTPTRVVGAHLEGPYISYKKKGAQPEAFLLVPERDGYDFILKNKDIIKDVTIATELDGAIDMVKELTDCGIMVSCGHDDGREDTIKPAIDAGLRHCTHWYCAMSTANIADGVRSVGMMETALIDPRVTIELIADNHHIIPALQRLAYQSKGPLGMCVVSDCLRAAGLEAGDNIYTLGSDDGVPHYFKITNGLARLLDGTFAGSVQPVSQMIKNLVNDGRIPLEDAVCAASYSPAKIIGMDNEIGSIRQGNKADFCIMDKELNVVATIKDGKVVYKK